MKRAWVIALLLVGCQSAPSLGTSCTRASDCASPLVCANGRCRSECAETRDCPPGSECIPIASGSAACTLAEERCVADTDCTAPLVCGNDGTCRAACLTDADCTADGRCVLAGRLVCVAPQMHGPPACTGATNTGFAAGTMGWCIETSSGLDAASVVTSIAAGFDGHAVRIDLENAPVGAWVRLYQEIPLDGTRSVVFDRTSADVAGGTTLVAIELIDDAGLVLGRVARAVAGDGASDCGETGHGTAACVVEPFSPSVAMTPALASATDYANVDLREVAAVRYVLELAHTAPGATDLVVDDVGSYALPCVEGWWRQETHLASFDLDQPTMPPSGFSFADAPLRSFVLGECGQALSLDGTQAIDWTGTLPETYTVSFAWHGTIHHQPIDGVSFVHETGGGDVDLSVRAGQIVLDGCGVTIADSARIVETDARFQEMQVLVDRHDGRLCLARSGRLVGCVVAPACMGAPSPTGLRFVETAAPLGDEMGIDEIRIDTGVAMPDGTVPATHECTLDLACHEYGSFRLRDVGSRECVDTSACTRTWLCPEAARATDASLCGATSAMACAVDATCPFGARGCDGMPCEGLRLERCTQPLLAACP
jgi:hypothetical protein